MKYILTYLDSTTDEPQDDLDGAMEMAREIYDSYPKLCKSVKGIYTDAGKEIISHYLLDLKFDEADKMQDDDQPSFYSEHALTLRDVL